MKVLIHHASPFALAHGGVQVQIERTAASLTGIGLQVEFLRWWDPDQRGDLLHIFGPARVDLIQGARTRGMPVVLTSFFSEPCNRPLRNLRFQGLVLRTLLALPAGERLWRQLPWRTYQTCSQNVVGLRAEARVLQTLYHVPAESISTVPLGVSRAFLESPVIQPDGPHLICVGTITEVKRQRELARLALAAQVPILFVGKPYSPASGYWLDFQSLVDGRWVKYHSHVANEQELVGLMQGARGFVLYSRFENWCLTAHEAAACGLPLLLPAARWSEERFGDQARYFGRSEETNGDTLLRFFEEARTLGRPTMRLFSWEEVARQLKTVYEETLARESGPPPG
jgi:glycosyltransferase involved in cell wall biosynthesis